MRVHGEARATAAAADFVVASSPGDDAGTQATVLRPPVRRRDQSRGLLPGLALLVALTYLVGRSGWYTSGDDVGYYLGLAGGVLMLLLLTYPLRKHLPAMRHCGKAKSWFAGHMVLGLLGPLLVLAHTTWRVGSTNALVALVSMLLVAASGVIGRFVYVRIHKGLYGGKTTLRELQGVVGLTSEQVRSNLSFAPGVEKRIRDFEATAMPGFESLARDAWRFVTLGARRQLALLGCRRELRRAMEERARSRGWHRAKFRRRLAGIEGLVRDYLAALQRVSQFAVYERIFSLWHVLHVPLVYLLVVSAIAHVVAVHLY